MLENAMNTAEHFERIKTPESLAKGGRATGKQNVLTGRLEFAQRRGRHIRWHENRNICKSGECEFCQKAIAETNELQ